MPNQLSSIKHVVQLMLENRSFDQMLGFLYEANGNKSPTNQPFEGLTGHESNPDETGRELEVYKIDRASKHPYFMPGADPGEGFHNTSYQLFSTDDPAPGAIPTNTGFVVNFKAAIASGNVADHVGIGEGLRRLRSLVFIGSYPDHTKSILCRRSDFARTSR